LGSGACGDGVLGFVGVREKREERREKREGRREKREERREKREDREREREKRKQKGTARQSNKASSAEMCLRERKAEKM